MRDVDQTALDSFDVMQINTDFQKAVMEKDRLALERMVADEYIFINPSGLRLNKHQVIEDIMVRIGYNNYKAGELTVQVYGNLAVSTSFFSMRGRLNNRVIDGHFRETKTFVKRETGIWQIIASRVTRLPEEKEEVV